MENLGGYWIWSTYLGGNANQNKPDNGQRHRVTHPVYTIIHLILELSGLRILDAPLCHNYLALSQGQKPMGTGED